MSALIWIPVALIVAVGMELWAGLLHGRIWHSVLWSVHRSHHRKRRGRMEANDALSVLHAPIAIAFILYGCRAHPGTLREIVFGVGIGMTMFGLSYLVVHDGLVHERLPVSGLLRFEYFRRVRDAHLVHHTTARGKAPYGLFFGPWETDPITRATAPSRDASPTWPPKRSRDPETPPGKPEGASSTSP